MRKRILFLLPVLLIGCGSELGEDGIGVDDSVATGALPYINRVDPTSASAGETVTIFGFGFSSATSVNVILIDGKSVSADTYEILDKTALGEIEKITFKVPAGTTLGKRDISVSVFDNISNNDVLLSVD